ncbi:MAG: hypothetical protein HGA96_11570 [Desulfobulbaceae bacterium]|nr:hypothetical protein [Desulfobulbaceae bacterium]
MKKIVFIVGFAFSILFFYIYPRQPFLPEEYNKKIFYPGVNVIQQNINRFCIERGFPPQQNHIAAMIHYADVDADTTNFEIEYIKDGEFCVVINTAEQDSLLYKYNGKKVIYTPEIGHRPGDLLSIKKVLRWSVSGDIVTELGMKETSSSE